MGVSEGEEWREGVRGWGHDSHRGREVPESEGAVVALREAGGEVRSDIVLAAIEVQGRASGPLLAQGFGPSRPSPFASRSRGGGQGTRRPWI